MVEALNQAAIGGHHSGLWWAIAGVCMVVLATVILAAIALLMRYGLYLVTERPGRRRKDPLRDLDRELAVGKITPEQYTDRRVALGFGPRP